MNKSIERQRDEITELFKDNKFVVFLCGPTITDTKKQSSILRKTIHDRLIDEKFEVVLGEDDGLKRLQSTFTFDAQTNELLFIERQSQAVVLIADSPGSFCELGLFSDWFSSKAENRDFILIVNKLYEPDDSYLNLGPASLIQTMGGLVIYNNFSSTEIDDVIDRLKKRRAVFLAETRGRR